MNKIMALGFVIYSYGILEQNSNEIISWLKKIEDWIGHSFTEYNFVPRGKESRRVYKLNSKTFNAFSTRIFEEKPWSVINIGWPEKV